MTLSETVSDILIARAQHADTIGRPVAVSLAVHAGLVVALAVLPAAWFATPKENTITISIGSGTVGPNRQGSTAVSGRRVDQAVEPPKREVVTPNVAPKAVTPDPVAPPVKTPPKPEVKTPAPPTAMLPTTKPATGAEVSKGNAVIETGAKGLGAGLASGGLGGVSADPNFCCKDYLAEMMAAIAARWRDRQGIAGTTVVEFTIQKDGSVTDVAVVQKSGVDLLDLVAKSAVTDLKLLPIPDKYPGQRMFISLKFPYQR
jgi:TonB family protein